MADEKMQRSGLVKAFESARIRRQVVGEPELIMVRRSDLKKLFTDLELRITTLDTQLVCLEQELNAAKLALREIPKMLGQPGVKPTRIQEIIQLVSDEFGISVNDLLEPRRRQFQVWPRQVAMYLSRKCTPLSWVSIGRAFGRDHGAIYHAFKVVTDQMEVNQATADFIAGLERWLNEE